MSKIGSMGKNNNYYYFKKMMDEFQRRYPKTESIDESESKMSVNENLYKKTNGNKEHNKKFVLKMNE